MPIWIYWILLYCSGAYIGPIVAEQSISIGNMVFISLLPMIFTALFLFISTRVKDNGEMSVFVALIGGLLTGWWITVFNVPPQESEE
jgi:hypothetical protein